MADNSTVNKITTAHITTNLQEWLKTLPCDQCPARFQCDLYCGNYSNHNNSGNLNNLNDCFKTFTAWAVKSAD